MIGFESSDKIECGVKEKKTGKVRRMRAILLGLLMLMLSGCVSTMPESQNIYDKKGYYQGRIDSSGRIFNRRGYYVGEIK